jgi:hypothetical protein
MPEKVNGNKFSGKSNTASLNSGNTSIEPKSAVQLNSTEHKLATVQKMANNSPYSQRFAQLKSLANKNTTPKQPVSQLSRDSHSLPDNVKHGVESLSGISMDDVKVHYNSAKPAQLNAHAYAQGTDIHIASGQEKHLPHEAWHVVQQKQGRVRPTTMMKAKVPINDDQGLEKEADVMGARALQMKPFSLSDYKTGNSLQKEGIVQKVGWWGKKKPSGDKEEKERISAMKLSKIKFNFAGSGEKTWKTHKEKYRKGRPSSRLGRLAENVAHFTGYRKIKENEKIKGFEKKEHIFGGKKMVKEKENKEQKGTKSMVVEYAGPISKFGIGPISKLGLFDSGKNSTEKNLKDAQETLKTLLTQISTELPKDFKIAIDIKGFSRGAATASTFAAWAKKSEWSKNLDIRLLLIDTVDGGKFSAKMQNNEDVTDVYDEKEIDKDGKDKDGKDEDRKDTTGTTLMMPIQSGHWGSSFTPQKIKGYQRLIIIYGSKAKHSFALGESNKSTLFYGKDAYKGMKLTTLPKGLYVVNSNDQPLRLTKVTYMDSWRSIWKPIILGKANKKEERDKVIENLEIELAKYMIDQGTNR